MFFYPLIEVRFVKIDQRINKVMQMCVLDEAMESVNQKMLILEMAFLSYNTSDYWIH